MTEAVQTRETSQRVLWGFAALRVIDPEVARKGNWWPEFCRTHDALEATLEREAEAYNKALDAVIVGLRSEVTARVTMGEDRDAIPFQAMLNTVLEMRKPK